MYSTSENRERALLAQVRTFNVCCARFEENLNNVANYIEGSRVRKWGDFSKFVVELERDSRLIKSSYAKIQTLKAKDCCLKKVAFDSAKKVRHLFFGESEPIVVLAKEQKHRDSLEELSTLRKILSDQLKRAEAKSGLVTDCDKVLKRLRKMEGNVKKMEKEAESDFRLNRGGFYRSRAQSGSNSLSSGSSVSSGDVDSPLPTSDETDERR